MGEMLSKPFLKMFFSGRILVHQGSPIILCFSNPIPPPFLEWIKGEGMVSSVLLSVLWVDSMAESEKFHDLIWDR